MSSDVINVIPSNGSTLNDLDTVVMFTITGVSDVDFLSLGITNGVETIFSEGAFQGYFSTSSFLLSDGKYIFSIIKTGGYAEDSNIYIKVFGPGSVNFTYQAGLVPNKPFLYFSNVSNGDVIRKPKKIHLEFSDFISDIDINSVNLNMSGYTLIDGGVVDSSFDGYTTINVDEYTSIAIDSFLIISVDHPEYFKNGEYIINYSMSNALGKVLMGQLLFSIRLDIQLLPPIFPQVSSSGYNLGLKEASDQGDGGSISVSWNKFISRSHKSEMMGLLYVSTNRFSLFDNLPSYISFGDVTSVTLTDMTVGFPISFAVRGLEAYNGTFSETGLVPYQAGFYVFPSATVTSEVTIDNSSYISVASTVGYPDKGLLLLSKNEVVKYSSKDDLKFYIVANGRGLNNTSIAIHPIGSSLELFVSCQDSNTNIISSTPTYEWGSNSDRELNRVGETVLDFTEDEKKQVSGFDYCGYHQSMPEDILGGGGSCGSYLGGEFSGSRGFNLYDRLNSRNEVLLEQVGEPIILLKRKWEGQQCDCISLRRENARMKTCFRCYGTGYVGGYDQIINRRRHDSRVLIRFKEAKDDLDFGADKDYSLNMSPSCWTLPTPMIRDMDIVVRFGFDNILEHMFEVIDVSRERIVYQHYGKQNLTLKKLDKTDIVYTFKFQE